MKYTPYDLDRMRGAIHSLLTPPGVSYDPKHVDQMVERQLVTYVMNETTADELEAHAREVCDSAVELRYFDRSEW